MMFNLTKDTHENMDNCFTDKLVLYHSPSLLEKIKTLPISIGIVGESASGKSTITEDFVKVLSKYYTVTRINTDDYYYDNSEAVKQAGSFAEWAKDKDLDCPEAMDLKLMKEHITCLRQGNSVYLPKYYMDGSAIRKDKYKLAIPSDIIISEGLFTMCVKDCFDITIYIDIDRETQKKRWYKRVAKRKLGSSADVLYGRAIDRAEKYIIPHKDTCDIVLSGVGPKNKYKRLIERFLQLVYEKQPQIFN